MSDTKALIKYVRDRLNEGPNITFGKPTVYDLVEALEQAEAENARLQQRVNELISEELTDGAVRERIQLRFNMHEVLQQNERLTKERDWLAEACAEHCHDKYGDDARCSFVGCEPVHCSHATTGQWKEAARRAVAAGEETCQK